MQRLKFCSFLTALFCLAISTASCVENMEDTPTPASSSDDKAVARVQSVFDLLMQRPDIPDSRVTVEHILVMVKEDNKITRSNEKAATIASDILDKLGRDSSQWKSLWEEHDEDPGHKPYVLVDTKRFPSEKVNTAIEEGDRARMYKWFSEIAYRLKVGEVGVCPFDPNSPQNSPTSPSGIHIIKRIK